MAEAFDGVDLEEILRDMAGALDEGLGARNDLKRLEEAVSRASRNGNPCRKRQTLPKTHFLANA